MRGALAALPLCVFAAKATALPSQNTFVGGAPAYQEWVMDVNGVPRTIVQMSGYFHQMNLPPHHGQPIGLEEFYYVIKDAKPWNAARCETWIRRVDNDEILWQQNQTVYPYWQIQIAGDAKPITVEGYTLWQDRDVTCWEAMDFGPPLY